MVILWHRKDLWHLKAVILTMTCVSSTITMRYNSTTLDASFHRNVNHVELQN